MPLQLLVRDGRALIAVVVVVDVIIQVKVLAKPNHSKKLLG